MKGPKYTQTLSLPIYIFSTINLHNCHTYNVASRWKPTPLPCNFSFLSSIQVNYNIILINSFLVHPVQLYISTKECNHSLHLIYIVKLLKYDFSNIIKIYVQVWRFLKIHFWHLQMNAMYDTMTTEWWNYY